MGGHDESASDETAKYAKTEEDDLLHQNESGTLHALRNYCDGQHADLPPT